VINHPVFTLCLAFAAFVSVSAYDSEVVYESLMQYDNPLQHQRNHSNSFQVFPTNNTHLHTMSSSKHPIAPTTAQRDADYHYSQQLTKLQDEIMDLNKIIENTAADHRREAHPL